MEATDYMDKVLNKQRSTIRDQFNKDRKCHNKEFYEEGGSPHNDTVWELFQGHFLKGAKGKLVFKQLKDLIPKSAFREDAILSHQPTTEIALSLK